ncbi:MAG: formylmethanofuran dehydrogenase subunit E family protein [Candidatus Omnitrophica bacterium]|nr:formylmethanofuran dehydrogenase subunit E family protein [Candidatus Omnitrophota bacterium]
MRNRKITLTEAIKFHGHLGPYLILGLRAGELALKELKCRKYFGLGVKVWGVSLRPKLCLIDGLQLSTGATYGKGNITKFNGSIIKLVVKDRDNSKKVTLTFKEDLVKELKGVKTHSESESLARMIYRTSNSKLFTIRR